MSELAEKEARAIDLLRKLSSEDPLYIAYSGGKDSDVIRILAEKSGANYELHHNLTTVDAPETVYYVKKYVKDEFIHRPKRSMWQLIVDQGMPPTRIARYCCAELKEGGGVGQRTVTGVRWSESAKRRKNHGLFTIIGKERNTMQIAEGESAPFVKAGRGVVLNNDNAESRRVVEMCYRTRKTMINPIIEWTDKDVWEYLHANGCGANPLYQRGWKRIGCIGCPLGGGKRMKAELTEYPKYKAAYTRAFERMCKAREAKGKLHGFFTNGESVMKWWVGDDPFQITVEEWLAFEEEQRAIMDEYSLPLDRG